MQAAGLVLAAQPCTSRANAQRSRLLVRAIGRGVSGSTGEQQPPGAAEQPSHNSAAAPPGATLPFCTELPGGALWWQHLHSSSTTPIYGTSFVLQRPRVGGPGLVRAVQQPKPVRQAAVPPPPPPVVWQAPGAGAGLALAGSSLGRGSVVIDTDFVVLPAQSEAPAVQPNTTCVGIVWQPSEESEAQEQEQEQAARASRRRGKHPRRTQALRFTCNLCGEVNDAAVNPHAWRKGSVFARCQGCTAVHKLRDNLRIFHELAGPVFPPRELRANYLVQEILDRIQENNRS